MDKKYLIEKIDACKDFDWSVLDIQPIIAEGRDAYFGMYMVKKSKMKSIEDLVLFMILRMQESNMRPEQYGKSFIETNSFTDLSKEAFLKLLNTLIWLDKELPSPLILESELATYIRGYIVALTQNSQYCFVVETKNYYVGYFWYYWYFG